MSQERISTELGSGADALQPALRCGFQARFTAGVRRLRGRIVSIPITAVLCAILLGRSSVPLVHAADKLRLETDPQQRLDVRYRLFKTENIWTFLELDTQTGRLW